MAALAAISQRINPSSRKRQKNVRRAMTKPALLATLEGRPLPDLDLPYGLKSLEAASFKGWG